MYEYRNHSNGTPQNDVFEIFRHNDGFQMKKFGNKDGEYYFQARDLNFRTQLNFQNIGE